MGNFLAFFYLLTALVWLYRSRRALSALKENPQVEPAPLDPVPKMTGLTGPVPSPPASVPWVSVLVPVKNEEANVAACLEGFLKQGYPSLEIIVMNDHSIDRTGDILAEFARLYPDKIRTLSAPAAPPGWTGKNWALAEGAPLAQGEWLLFTDADTRHQPWSVASSVSHAEAKDLDLLTLSPRCLAESFWERALVPAAMAFLGLWFPLARANDPSSSSIFGNGQFLMIRKKTYRALGGHAQVKGAYLEDFALVREAKLAGFRVECAIGTQIYGTRMYRSFSGIWLGWRRIFFHAFEKNPLRLLAKAFSLLLFSFFPFFFFPVLTQRAFADPRHFGNFWGASFPILALILLTAWKAHSVVGAPRRYAFLHPLTGFVLAGILADAAWAAWEKKEMKWR